MIILSPQLGISPTATTGGETYDRELLKQFVKMGQEVRILLPKNKPIPVEIPEKTVGRTPVSHFVPPYTFNLFSIPWVYIRSDLGDPRSDLYRKQSSGSTPRVSFFTGYLIKKLFPKIFLVVHYHLDQTGWLWTKNEQDLVKYGRRSHRRFGVLKKPINRKSGHRSKKIHVIYCGVDVDSIKPEINKGPALLQQQGRALPKLRQYCFSEDLLNVNALI